MLPVYRRRASNCEGGELGDEDMEKLAAKDATSEKKRLREERAAETDRVKAKKPKRRRWRPERVVTRSSSPIPPSSPPLHLVLISEVLSPLQSDEK